MMGVTTVFSPGIAFGAEVTDSQDEEPVVLTEGDEDPSGGVSKNGKDDVSKNGSVSNPSVSDPSVSKDEITVIDKGRSGEIYWTLFSNGKLFLDTKESEENKEENNESDEVTLGLSDSYNGSPEMEDYENGNLTPWYKYKDQITQVECLEEIHIGNHAFEGLPNLRTALFRSVEITDFGEYSFKDCSSLKTIVYDNGIGYYVTPTYTTFKRNHVFDGDKIADIYIRVKNNGDPSIDPSKENESKNANSAIAKAVEHVLYVPHNRDNYGYGNRDEEENTEGEYSDRFYTVSLDSAGGSKLTFPERYIMADTTLAGTEEVTKADSLLWGWYISEDEPFGTDDKVVDDISITAKWVATGKVLKSESNKKYSKDVGWILYEGGLLYITGSGKLYSSAFPNGKSKNRKIQKVIIDGENVLNYKTNTYEFPWYKYRNMITAVYLGDGITAVDGYAFMDLSVLRDIRIPDSLNTVESYAFTNCSSLDNVRLPADIRTVGEYAFGGCSSLQTIRLGREKTDEEMKKDNNYNNNYNYNNNKNYNSYSGSNSYPTISDRVFKGCKSLTAAELFGSYSIYQSRSSNDDIVGGKLFEGCDNLTAVYMSRGVTSIPFSNKNESLRIIYYEGEQGEFEEKFDSILMNSTLLDDKKIIYGASRFYWNTVKYNSGGHGSVPAKKVVSECTIVKMPQPEPYWDEGDKHYWVSKWCRISEDLDSAFRFGEDTVSTNMTLYGHWDEAKPVEVNFYLTKDKIYKTLTVYQGRKIPIPAVPTRDDYVFAGWFSTPDKYEKGTIYLGDDTGLYDFSDYVVSEEPISIYAHWAEEGLDGFYTSKTNGGYTVSFNFTESVSFDGRKHVYKVPGKPWKNTKSKISDIRVGNIVVTDHNGNIVNGVEISKVKVKGGKNVPTDYVIDKNDGAGIILGIKVKAANKSLQKDINKLLNGKRKKYTSREDGETDTWYEWTAEPIKVDYTPIEIPANPEIYLSSEVKASPDLQKKDGIFIYSGGVKVKYKKSREDKEDDYDYTSMKATVKGLCYQKVFDLGNGKTAVKRIKLKAGGWKHKKYSEGKGEDRETWTESVFTPKQCDYYIGEGSVSKGDTDVTVTCIGNFNGSLTFPMK